MTLWCCLVTLSFTIYHLKNMGWIISAVIMVTKNTYAGLLTVNNLYGSFLLQWDLNTAQAPDLLEISTCNAPHFYTTHTTTHTHYHTTDRQTDRQTDTHTRAGSTRLSLIQYEISSTFCHEIITPKPNPL